ncbi:MAG TPA: DUF4386 family protein [Anaerolineales bacterium]|nr:DUF4386 family protein [Anaerolineales bacterium]
MEASNMEVTNPAWKTFYKFAAVAALLMVVIIVIQMIVFITAPPPLEGTAIDWFMLFQWNRLIGLIDFELLMIIYTLISIPMTLALYRALRQVNSALMTLYVVLSLVGVVCFIAARPAFEMLWLSDQYSAAMTEVERSNILAAGEATLATFHGTAFHISYVLGSISGLIISLVMLRSRVFSKATAYVRIGSSIFDFGLYIPTIGTYLSIFSVMFLLIWNIMVARRLIQLSDSTDTPIQWNKSFIKST